MNGQIDMESVKYEVGDYVTMLINKCPWCDELENVKVEILWLDTISFVGVYRRKYDMGRIVGKFKWTDIL